MSYYSEECVDQGRVLTSEVKVDEDPMPISFRMVKHEPESSLCTAGTKFLDQPVSGIKEEYEDQSQDLKTEIKFEEDPVPISFPVVKREPEEEQSDLDTVNEEPRVEGTAEDNEIFTECYQKVSVSSEFDGIAHEGTRLCEIPKNSDSSGKYAPTHEDKQELQFEMSKECLSNPAKSTMHLRERVGKNVYKCDICGRSFSKSTRIKDMHYCTQETNLSDVMILCHLRTHELLHTGEKSFKCDVCGKCLSTSGNLSEHKRMHTAEKPFKCEVCGKCFSKSCSVKSHERLHTGEKPFKCVVCGRCFSQSCHLKSHERLHTGEKPFKCVVCGKCFSHSCNLRSHERLHTGEKPFKCIVCGKCFSQSTHLRGHERLHTGEQTFKCDVCGKCFSQSCNLRNHERLHTGEKPFKCIVCGKCFSQSYNLSSHERLHTAEKPFKCVVCDGTQFDPLAVQSCGDADTMETKFSPDERNLLDEHMAGVKMEYVDQSHDFASEVKFEENPEPISFPVVKDEPEERNFADLHVTGIKEEYGDQSHDLTTEIKFEEDPVPISFPVVKRDPEAYAKMSYYSEECVDQGRVLTSEVKVDEDPMPISFRMVKHEPEERNFLDQPVSGIKEEYEDQSQDLTTEIKFEEDPVPISFPVVKREPEEEQSDLDAVNEEPRVEGTTEDNEIFTEWFITPVSPAGIFPISVVLSHGFERDFRLVWPDRAPSNEAIVDPS
ncbi:hypothetical protein ANN_27949 [Periplaneta americana]|uniref:C2H2-type domain-containing protein n=1 Tax=Periplaneta americana TaxID=6978 RepID=A0ABQ8RUA3_PERAM|nr:hypothetical protein ANN_27949 [Periplaneta americana]